jgi:CHAD domain
LDFCVVNAHVASSKVGNELAAFAVAQLQRAIDYLAQPGKARHKGIHEGRKCIRRTRATLALAAGAFKRGNCANRAKRLDLDLGQLCRGLSPLRDAQALLEALARLNALAPDVSAILPDAMKAAEAKRDQLLQRALRHSPDFLSRRARLATAIKRLRTLAWQDISPTDVASALARSMRRVKKAERKAHRHPAQDETWHLYRRRLRRLRQQDSLMATIQPELRPVFEGLEQQAERLGESQDDALLLKHCGKRSPFAPSQRKILRRTASARLRLIRKL